MLWITREFLKLQLVALTEQVGLIGAPTPQPKIIIQHPWLDSKHLHMAYSIVYRARLWEEILSPSSQTIQKYIYYCNVNGVLLLQPM